MIKMRVIESTTAHKAAMAERGDSFAQFMRNGVWGTCVDCPRDSNGKVYPEFCENGYRYDHKLNIDGLIAQYKHYFK